MSAWVQFCGDSWIYVVRAWTVEGDLWILSSVEKIELPRSCDSSNTITQETWNNNMFMFMCEDNTITQETWSTTIYVYVNFELVDHDLKTMILIAVKTLKFFIKTRCLCLCVSVRTGINEVPPHKIYRPRSTRSTWIDLDRPESVSLNIGWYILLVDIFRWSICSVGRHILFVDYSVVRTGKTFNV